MKNVSDKFVEKIRKTFFWNDFFFRNSCRLCDNVEKYCRVGQATSDSMAHANGVLDNNGNRHTLRICNTLYSSAATNFARTPLIVM